MSTPLGKHSFVPTLSSSWFLSYLNNITDYYFELNRLPRRYSNKRRDTSVPIVSSSGSAPLHFPAANGHRNVARTLLSHGAHADRQKHGVTPEMLARGNEKEDTADVLKEWLENKDKDLRER